jgi:RNA polymerase sigma-70 factor (ECF subfamily)
MNSAHQMQPLTSPLTDEEVVKRVRGGDVPLFEVLMRRHNGKLYRAIRSIVRDEAHTEELMQDSYVKAYENLAGFEGRARFSTWLVQIGVNEAIARTRRAKVSPVDESEVLPLDIPAQQRDPEGLAAGRELVGLLERAVSELPDGYREVFMLRQVEGFSVAETAEALNVSEETVKTRTFRANERLRARLDTWFDGSTRELFSFPIPRCNRIVAGVLARIG